MKYDEFTNDSERFDILVEALKKKGYNVYLEEQTKQKRRVAKVTGNKILGYIYEYQYKDTDTRFNDTFTFDSKQNFDKMSRSPFILPIPETEAQLNFLLEKMQWIITEEGIEFSSDMLPPYQTMNYPRKLRTLFSYHADRQEFYYR